MRLRTAGTSLGTRQAHHRSRTAELLHESILRGVTGTLTAGHADAVGHAIHLMQGEIIGAEGPDDDIWLVRRLTAQGAITERQGVAFTRSIERTGKLDAHLLDELPAPLHVALRAGRFRQNVLEFLRSPDPVRFDRERTLFRDHAEVGHDSGALVEELAALRAHVEGLQQQVHGGHRLRPGPTGAQDADQARLLDLVDPAMSLHDLVTFSPFEEGRTLALVRDMIEARALSADPPIRLTATPPGPGAAPDGAHAHESLFSAGSSLDDLVEIAVEGPARFNDVFGRLSNAPQLVSAFHDLEGFHAGAEEPGDWGDEVPGDYGGLASGKADLVVEDVFDEALFEDLTRPDPSTLPPTPAAPAALAAAAPPAPPPVGDPPGAVEAEPSLHQLMGRTAAAIRPDPHASARALVEPPSLLSPTVTPVREEALVEEAPSEDFPALGAGLAAALADAEAAVQSGVREDDWLGDEETAPFVRPVAPAEPAAQIEDLFDLGDDPEGVDDFQDAHTEQVPRTAAPVPNLRAGGAAAPPPIPSPPVPDALPAQMVETLFDDGLLDAETDADADAEPAHAAPAEVEADADADADDLPELLDPGALEPLDSGAPAGTGSAEDDTLEAAEELDFGAADETLEFGAVDDAAGMGSDGAAEGSPSPEVAAALRRAEEESARRAAAREVAEYDDDDLLVSHPPRTDLFDFGDDVDDDEMAMFRDHDRFRGAGQGQFTLSKKLLDVVDLTGGEAGSGELPPPVEFPAGFGTPHMAEDGDDDGMLEMGDAESASLTDADKVVALNFSAPTLELAEMDKKLRVTADVLSRISEALDAQLGPGAGQASVQLLLDGAPSAYAVVFQGLEAGLDGRFDVSNAARNIRRRPAGEHRRLIDNGTMDLIERGLSYAVAELDDAAMDALLGSIAGYQQRLRS